ncbi:MAG: hypothetical protein IKD31_03145 [Clostridia bacterium]|nr:hypothetical protein [Clostridia bacterium]
MKNRVLRFLMLIALLFFSSCNFRPKESFEIPTVGETIPLSAEKKMDESDLVRKEQEYHRNLGMIVISDTDSEEYRAAYDQKSFEGQYRLLIDCLYRAKLDIGILRAKGVETKEYDCYEERIDSFLKENPPQCLLPQKWVKEERLEHFWREVFYRAAEYDAEKLFSNEDLMRLFEFDLLCRAENGTDVKTALSSYPRLVEMFFPPKAQFLSQGFDSERNQTVLSLCSHDAKEIWVKEGKNTISYSSQFVTVYPANTPILLSPSFEGEISVALMGENGLLGETVFISVSAAVEKISDTAVTFCSARLEQAIRAYLKRGASEPITQKDLASVHSVYWNGDVIYINPSPTEIPLEILNQNIPAQIDDFSWEDFDFFPCLSNLEVRYNAAGNPQGRAVSSLFSLKLVSCGITDLSGLKNCTVAQLVLEQNEIQNAEILSDARSLEFLSLCQNPLKKFLLPKKPLSTVNVRNTLLSDLSFLDSVSFLKEMDLTETKISDVKALSYDPPKEIRAIYLPEGVAWEELKKISSLENLYVGDKEISLK